MLIFQVEKLVPLHIYGKEIMCVCVINLPHIAKKINIISN